MVLGVLRVELDGRAQLLDRLVQVLLGVQRGAEVEVGLVVVILELDGLAVRVDRLVRPALAP
jgi:hypothetical protein